MKTYRVAAVLTFGAMISACGSRPTQMYDGPPLDPSQIASVWSAKPWSSPQDKVHSETPRLAGIIKIESVDGRSTTKFYGQDAPYVVYVQPGHRTFQVGYEAGGILAGSPYSWVSEGTIAADLVAGSSYAIDAKPDFENRKMYFYVRPLHPNEQ